MKTGTWKKERAVGRKFSASDEHGRPKAHSSKKYWVGAYVRDGKEIAGHWHRNPNYKK